MQAKEIETALEDVVHADTQRHEDGFDLTVAHIHELREPGRIDFGGGELEPARTERVATAKRDPDDDYGWWTLEPGTYLVEYNEFLTAEHQRLFLQPRDALLAQGAHHPSLLVTELPKMPLHVGDAGVRIKENARVSTLLPL